MILPNKNSVCEYMTTRVTEKTAISGTGGIKISWERAKESLSDV